MNQQPRAFGSLVGIAAAYVVSLGIYELMLIGTCSTPAGPGETPCPEGVETYFFYVFFGILAAMASIFLGGSWLSFAALFGGVGLGAVRAGLAEGGQGWFLLFGGAFLFVPLVMVVTMPFATRSPATAPTPTLAAPRAPLWRLVEWARRRPQ